MAMMYIKKSLIFLLGIFVLLIVDMVIVLTTSNLMRTALINSVDGALIHNVDDHILSHSQVRGLEGAVRSTFNDVLRGELMLDADFRDDTFFRGGVSVDQFYFLAVEGEPIIRAEISTKIDTILADLLLPNQTKIRVNNFDQLFWDWS